MPAQAHGKLRGSRENQGEKQEKARKKAKLYGVRNARVEMSAR